MGAAMNIDRLVKRTAILVFTLCVIGVAIAGTVATQKPGDWALKKQGDNTILSRYPTLDECVKAAPAGKYKCDTSVALEVTGTCDDVPKPSIPRTKDADGFNVQPPIRYKEGTEGDLTDVEIQDYVSAPYPTCWVLGWRDAKVEDLAPPTADAGTVNEPVQQSAEFLAEWSSEESQAARHLVHICYPEDTLPCSVTAVGAVPAQGAGG
jgi:hypothetical protein